MEPINKSTDEKSDQNILVSGTPKVSVLIPTYKYGHYIGTAIESILNQSFGDFELIVCDDVSGDSTARVVGEYAKKDDRIRFIENVKNRGMTENWNFTLKEARGEYIKFVFGDDLLLSDDCLAEMVKVLDADESVSLVTSAREILDEKGKRLKRWAFPGSEGKYEGPRVTWGCLLLNANFIGEPSSVMFRRKDAARGFDTNYRQLVDMEMWFHLLEKGSLYAIPRSLCAFRVHAEQQTEKNKLTNRHEIEMLNLHASYKQIIYTSRIAMGSVTAFFYVQFLPAYFLYNIIRRKISLKLTNTALGNRFWIVKGALLLIPYLIGRTLRRFSRSARKRLGFTPYSDSSFFKPTAPKVN